MCNEWSLLLKTNHLQSDSTLKWQGGIFFKTIKNWTQYFLCFVNNLATISQLHSCKCLSLHYVLQRKNFQLQFFVISSSCQRLCLADDRKTRVATRDSLLLSFCLSVYSLNSLSLLDNPFIISVFLHCHHLFLSVYSFNLSAFLLSLSFLIDFSVCLFI